MTADPIDAPPPALPFGPGHPLWLSDDEIRLLTDDEYAVYCDILRAEAEGLGAPIEGSPGQLADELGGADLHPRHLRLVDDAYMRMERGEVKRTLIVMPPQHGKSSRTRWGSLHRCKNQPEHRIVVASAELDLAREHTRWVRNKLEENTVRLGLNTARDRRSARAWDIEGHRGGMYAVGIGGALTGRPADLLVLDDPVKESKAVETPEQRNAMWTWFTEVALTRLAPGGQVVVIMTRWHEDDIAGRILKGQEGSDWLVLHLPAICDDPDTDLLEREKGEVLWPGRYDLAEIEGKRKSLGSRSFAALYQGRPVPAGGTLLQRHWFQQQPDWPRAGKALRYIDFAATSAEEGGDPDWTVAALVALHEGRWWILDIERWRDSPHGQKQRLIALRNRDGRNMPIRAEQEPGSSGKLFVYDLATTVYAGYDFRARRSTGSKLLRAGPMLAAAEAGNITLLDDGSSDWVGPFLDEAESFPFGSHDDQVDAVAGAMSWLTGPVEEEQLVRQGRWSQTRSRR